MVFDQRTCFDGSNKPQDEPVTTCRGGVDEPEPKPIAIVAYQAVDVRQNAYDQAGHESPNALGIDFDRLFYMAVRRQCF